MTDHKTQFGPPREIIEQAARMFREQERRRYKESFGHGRVPVCARMGEKWMVGPAGYTCKHSQAVTTSQIS